MTLSDIWSIFFNSFMIFVGVGIIWMRFLEKLFPDQKTSVTVMIIVAVVLTVGNFVIGIWQIKQNIKKAQATVEAIDAQYEEAG